MSRLLIHPSRQSPIGFILDGKVFATIEMANFLESVGLNEGNNPDAEYNYTNNQISPLIFPALQDIENIKSQIAVLSAEITALTARVTTAEGKISLLESQVSSLETAVVTLQTQVGTLTTGLAALTATVTTHTTEIATNTGNISTNTASISAINTRINDVEVLTFTEVQDGS